MHFFPSWRDFPTHNSTLLLFSYLASTLVSSLDMGSTSHLGLSLMSCFALNLVLELALDLALTICDLKFMEIKAYHLLLF